MPRWEPITDSPKPRQEPAGISPQALLDAVRGIQLPVPQVTVQAPALSIPEPKVVVQSGQKQITKWVFSVQRDEDGFIKTITAEAN